MTAFEFKKASAAGNGRFRASGIPCDPVLTSYKYQQADSVMTVWGQGMYPVLSRKKTSPYPFGSNARRLGAPRRQV